jgi:hypothetical protein
MWNTAQLAASRIGAATRMSLRSMVACERCWMILRNRLGRSRRRVGIDRFRCSGWKVRVSPRSVVNPRTVASSRTVASPRTVASHDSPGSGAFVDADLLQPGLKQRTGGLPICIPTSQLALVCNRWNLDPLKPLTPEGGFPATVTGGFPALPILPLSLQAARPDQAPEAPQCCRPSRAAWAMASFR